jgi:hypothetical protein
MAINTASITSIGCLCSQLQKPYGQVRKAIELLGIKPVLIVNMVAHYSDDDVQLIAEHLREGK